MIRHWRRPLSGGIKGRPHLSRDGHDGDADDGDDRRLLERFALPGRSSRGPALHERRASVDAQQIKAFASAFDPQPFHIDERAATGSVFGGLVASGWHTASITMRLQVEGGLPIAGGLVGLGGQLTWPTATRPGDVLHVESEVVAVAPSRSRSDRGTVTVKSETRNQRGEVVQETTVTLLVPRRPTVSPVNGPA